MGGLSLNRKLNGSRYISYVTSQFPPYGPLDTHLFVEARGTIQTQNNVTPNVTQTN